jgi:hypothetical protein
VHRCGRVTRFSWTMEEPHHERKPHPTINCCECCKEGSLDTALIPEGTEYVVHFFGLECFQRSKSRVDESAASEPGHPCTPKVSTRHDG